MLSAAQLRVVQLLDLKSRLLRVHQLPQSCNRQITPVRQPLILLTAISLGHIGLY
jgi:hypothetical protein